MRKPGSTGRSWDGCGFIYEHEVKESTDILPVHIHTRRPVLVKFLFSASRAVTSLGYFLIPRVLWQRGVCWRMTTCLFIHYIFGFESFFWFYNLSVLSMLVVLLFWAGNKKQNFNWAWHAYTWSFYCVQLSAQVLILLMAFLVLIFFLLLLKLHSFMIVLGWNHGICLFLHDILVCLHIQCALFLHFD